MMQFTKKHTILHQNECLKYSPVINQRCTCVNVFPMFSHSSTSANAAFHIMQRHYTGPLYKNVGKTGFVFLTTQ